MPFRNLCTLWFSCSHPMQRLVIASVAPSLYSHALGLIAFDSLMAWLAYRNPIGCVTGQARGLGYAVYMVHILRWLSIDHAIKHNAPLAQWPLCPQSLRGYPMGPIVVRPGLWPSLRRPTAVAIATVLYDPTAPAELSHYLPPPGLSAHP